MTTLHSKANTKPLLERIESRLGIIEPLLGKSEPRLGILEPLLGRIESCFGIIKPVNGLNTKPNVFSFSLTKFVRMKNIFLLIRTPQEKTETKDNKSECRLGNLFRVKQAME